ncbi:hypothetical protein [Streptomyces canus]|uniref:Uncharacterized protein n=1 Tax=Streptomyces canus TaxID=58343 RepID=A0AAW8F3N4_9ACTN|nr:hypothetical protein [Streptomyces canus]MDQ0757402.1 hypothetical protein [Streptomyces canus]MDQ0904437.1 hypothetical protein [Streptomyces canus]MDQ1064665.1 hypothetical protein [Streptomyces canus]
MTFRTCPRGHAQDSAAALCARCVTGVERHLRVLPGLHQECLHPASPATRRTNPTKVSASRTRDHLDISVLDTRHHIHTVLESWSGMVVDKLGTTPPPRTVPHLARFLRRHLDWLAAQPPAADFVDEIESLVAELHRTIDPESGGGVHTLVRNCVVDGCTGKISAAPGGSGRAGSSRITCSGGHSWDMREWLGLRKLMERQREGADA